MKKKVRKRLEKALNLMLDDVPSDLRDNWSNRIAEMLGDVFEDVEIRSRGDSVKISKA